MVRDEDWIEEDDVIETDTDSLLDNDEVSAEEEGFMKGYEETENGESEEVTESSEEEEDLII